MNLEQAKNRAIATLTREIQRVKDRHGKTEHINMLKQRIRDIRKSESRYVATRSDWYSRYQFGVLDIFSVVWNDVIMCDEWNTKSTCKTKKEATKYL